MEGNMADRKVFHDSIVSLAHVGNDTQLGLVVNAAEPAHLDEPMSLHFSFGLSASAQAQLEKRVAAGDITSPQDQKYLPPEGDVKKLAGWLKDQGYTIDHQAADGIYATAPTSKIA